MQQAKTHKNHKWRTSLIAACVVAVLYPPYYYRQAHARTIADQDDQQASSVPDESPTKSSPLQFLAFYVGKEQAGSDATAADQSSQSTKFGSGGAKSESDQSSKQSSQAGAAPSNKPAQPASRRDNNPPPGFSPEELNVQQTNMISVYFQGQLLTNVLATYDADSIKFENPKLIVQSLADLKNDADKEKVLAAISKKLDAHANHLCPFDQRQKNKPFCQTLNPKVAGVIFNEEEYRADLFVSPDFISAPEQQARKQIPESTSGFSALAQNNFTASYDNNSQNYSLNNKTVLAYGATRLESIWNASQNRDTGSDEGGNVNNTVALQRAYLARYQNGTLYQAGMVSPGGGQFFASQPMLGIDLRNYNISPFSENDSSATPITVYLPLPSRVEVYKHNVLISTQNLPAGKQELNTSVFPEGSYDVKLKITDQTGKTSTEQRFFVKQAGLPPKGETHYSFAAGVLQSNVSVDTESDFHMPSFINTPAISYSESRRLTDDLGLHSSLLSNFNRVYLSAIADYYLPSIHIASGGMVSNNKRYGLIFNTEYVSPGGHVSFNWDTTRFFESGKTEATGDDQLRGSSFDPVSGVKLQSSANMQISLGKSSLGLGAQLTQPQGDDKQESYNISFSRPLFTSSMLGSTFSFNANRSQDDTTVNATIRFNFFTASGLSGNFSAGVSNADSNIGNDDEKQGSSYHGIYQAGVSKTLLSENHKQATVSANTSITPANRNYNVSGHYESSALAGDLNLNYNKQPQSQTKTSQYTLNLANTIAFAQGSFSSGYQGGLESGVIVRVNSKSPGKFKVMSDNQKIATISTNSSRAIFMPPYQRYRLSIEPAGDDSFEYDSSSKVVSIHPGNVASLSWNARKQYILFAQVVDAKGKPLPNLLLESEYQFDTTDQTGYIQAGVGTHQQQVTFTTPEGTSCTVELPKDVKVEHGLAVLDQPLVCKLTSKGKKD